MKYEKAYAKVEMFEDSVEFMAGSHNPATCSPYGTIVSLTTGDSYTCYNVAWTGKYKTENHVQYKSVTCSDVVPGFAFPNGTVVCGTFSIIS